VGVADDQIGPAPPPARQFAQELGPDRLGPGGAYFQAQNLVPPAAPDLEVGRIDSQTGPIPLDRAGEEGPQLRTHLADFVATCNFARRLKTLGGLAPYECICKIRTSEPDSINLNPIHQMSGLNI
jgi:hypothetical protein